MIVLSTPKNAPLDIPPINQANKPDIEPTIKACACKTTILPTIMSLAIL